MTDSNYTATIMDAMGEDEFIKHFGVKGMKWGQRKASSPSSVKERKPLTTRQKVNRARLAVGLTAVAVRYGPALAKIGMLTLGTIAVARNAQKTAAGKAAADSIIRGIGSESYTRLAQGADGVWRLANN